MTTETMERWCLCGHAEDAHLPEEWVPEGGAVCLTDNAAPIMCDCTFFLDDAGTLAGEIRELHQRIDDLGGVIGYLLKRRLRQLVARIDFLRDTAIARHLNS